ncbi:DUF4158 domain-containing protein [Streptosporangium sp. NPDC002544]|uniref:DUF4158 domain-containing protein n=1 Tax=Streptosporangium sp. NPDC002544 TaxID=3154538 RepID=UPI003330707B
MPVEVLDFVAEQLGITGPSQVKKYTERTETRFDHQWEIRRVRGWKASCTTVTNAAWKTSSAFSDSS